MGLLDNVIAGTHTLKDCVNERFGKGSDETIEDVVKSYAASRNIFCNDNEFAHELHMLGRYFEEFDYLDSYDR